MRHWIHEGAGWFLILLGLYVFFRCYQMLTDGNHYILEAGSLTFIGVMIFRGGIHLLKIAMAVRACETTRTALQNGRGNRVLSPTRPR